MKKLILFVAVALLSVSAFAETGKSIYQKYSGKEGVSSVYISPSMFKMMQHLPELEIEDQDVDITPIISSFEGLYILECENAGLSKALYEDVQKYCEGKDLEVLMEANESGENVKIMVALDGDYVKTFILVEFEASECNFICIEGKLLMEDLNTILSNVK
ncbi:MAG: DUF4252 domain-containing protein [Candidatus Cryptobacteroides sp.]